MLRNHRSLSQLVWVLLMVDGLLNATTELGRGIANTLNTGTGLLSTLTLHWLVFCMIWFRLFVGDTNMFLKERRLESHHCQECSIERGASSVLLLLQGLIVVAWSNLFGNDILFISALGLLLITNVWWIGLRLHRNSIVMDRLFEDRESTLRDHSEVNELNRRIQAWGFNNAMFLLFGVGWLIAFTGTDNLSFAGHVHPGLYALLLVSSVVDVISTRDMYQINMELVHRFASGDS